MMNGDMSGWYGSMGGGSWIFWGLCVVVAVVVVAVAVKYLGKSN